MKTKSKKISTDTNRSSIADWEVEMKKVEIAEKYQNMVESKKYAQRGFVMCIIRLISFYAIIVFHFIGILHLSSTEFVAVLTAIATINSPFFSIIKRLTQKLL